MYRPVDFCFILLLLLLPFYFYFSRNVTRTINSLFFYFIFILIIFQLPPGATWLESVVLIRTGKSNFYFFLNNSKRRNLLWDRGLSLSFLLFLWRELRNFKIRKLLSDRNDRCQLSKQKSIHFLFGKNEETRLHYISWWPLLSFWEEFFSGFDLNLKQKMI